MLNKLLLTAMAATTLAFAQGGGDTGGGGMGDSGGRGGGMGRGGDMGGGGGMGMGRAPKPSKADQMVSKLKLNKDQTVEFEKILVAANQEAAPYTASWCRAATFWQPCWSTASPKRISTR